jgi:hypothetical protein
MKKLISLMLVLVMCTLALTSCGGSPESAVEKLMAIYEDFDADSVKDLLPADMWEEIFEEMDMDEDDFFDDLQDTLDQGKEMIEENMEGYSFSYEIKDEDELDEDELDELNDELDSLLKDDITEAYILEVEMVVTYEDEDGDEQEDENEIEITVFKYDGDWYIHPSDIDFLGTL